MFIITDESALWICRECCLSSSRKTEEDRSVFSCRIGRAVHWKDSFLWKNEIHDRENRFLNFSSVSSSTDDDFTCCVINNHKALRVERCIISLEMRCVEDSEIRCMRCKLFHGWSNKHVPSERTVPSIVSNHTDWKGFGRFSTTGEVLHEEMFLF